MMGISVFELMKAYNISFEEAQILQFKIIGIMSLIIILLYITQILLKKLCPKIYRKLEQLNIVWIFNIFQNNYIEFYINFFSHWFNDYIKL